MKSLSKFNRKMELNGFSMRGEMIRNSQALLKSTFADDASFTLGVYLWELGLKSYSGKKCIPIRIYERRASNANGVTVKFQTLIENPVVVGDILYCSKTQEHFLCTESFNIDEIHWQGKLTLCNWILRWQNDVGRILEYPCVAFNATQYNSGEQANKQFTIGSSQHLVKLPCDKNTVILRTPQRFMLDKNYDNPITYIITQNDTTSYNFGTKGIVAITLLEQPINRETDRIDLGICDYKEPNSLQKDNSVSVTDGSGNTSKSVIQYQSKSIKSGGNAQTFVAKFYDDEDNEILDVLPKWAIVCDFVDKLIVEETDNKIMISIDDDNYVDDEFKLILSDINGNYQSSLIVAIKSLL